MDWTPQRLTEFATGYWAPGALLAAVELGVFDGLSAGRQSAAAVAAALRQDVGENRIAALLDALVALGFLDRQADGYAIAEGAAALLSRKSPDCMLGALAYNADLFRGWAHMAATFSAAGPSNSAPPDAEALRRFVYGMESKARVLAPAIAGQIDVGRATTLLDVGAGPGTLSRRLAALHPRLRVTLLDRSNVLAIAREIIAADPVAERLTYHPADYHAHVFPTGFDVVLFAGALHQEPPDAAARLAGKLLSALRPGGVLYVIDIMLSADRVSPPFAALFQLNMLLTRPAARVYSDVEVVALLERAGFASPLAVEVPQSIYRAVQARKPENRQ